VLLQEKLHAALESPIDFIRKGRMCSNLSGREMTRDAKASELNSSSSKELRSRGSRAGPRFGYGYSKFLKAKKIFFDNLIYKSIAHRSLLI